LEVKVGTVADGHDSLIGDGAIGELVAECVGHPKRRARNRDLPVVVLVGPRGSGKSERLGRLEAVYSGVVPSARVDLGDEAYRDDESKLVPRKVLAKLCFDLCERRRHFGRLEFPRLTLGLLAVGSVIDLSDRHQALEQLKRAINDDPNLRDLVDFFAQDLPDLLKILFPIVGWSALADESLINLWRKVAPILIGRAFRRAAGSWFVERVPGGANSVEDSLIKLNSFGRGGGEGVRLVDEILAEAFLADLSADFNMPVRHMDRVFNCVVLFDNVDTDAALSFLGLLVTARHRRSGEGLVHCDPLVVVAGSRYRHAPLFDGAVRGMQDSARYQDWLSRRSRQPASWFYVVELRNLTFDEVLHAVDEAGVVSDRRALTLVIHRLTTGHHATVSLLIDAVRSNAWLDHSGDELRKLLANVFGTGAGAEGLRLGDQTLAILLAGMLPPQRKHLVTCAAARNAAGACSLDIVGVESNDIDRLDQILRNEMWVTLDALLYPAPPPGAALADAASQATGHALLRRLLLWELALRHDGAATTSGHEQRTRPGGPPWTLVHETLRRRSVKESDHIGSMYHGLALEDIDSVSRSLNLGFREGRVREWLVELNVVASAPIKLNTVAELSEMSPAERVFAMCGTVGPCDPREQAIVGLMVAKWVLADPLSAPEGRHLQQIIDELRCLTHERIDWDDRKALNEEIRRYEELKSRWHL
jgi:hypothetical protein